MARNQKGCEVILNRVMHLLSGKKDHAKLMLRYIDSRRGKKNQKLTQEELDMIGAMRPLNRRGPITKED